MLSLPITEWQNMAEESPHSPDLTAVQDARGPGDPASAPHCTAMGGCPLSSRGDYHMPTLRPQLVTFLTVTEKAEGAVLTHPHFCSMDPKSLLHFLLSWVTMEKRRSPPEGHR